MSFSEAFARGFAIGDAAKKRRAVSKYFEKVKELTDEDDPLDEAAGEDVEIGGLKVPASAITPDAGESAIPAPAKPAARPAAIESPDTIEGTAAPAEAAIPVAGNYKTEPLEDLGAVDVDADAAIPISAPESITPGAAKKNAATREAKRSLTQANMKELDRLAMSAAYASGDMEVYTSLQKTSDSFLQGKFLKNMGLAQTALAKGDQDQAEKYLAAAYRVVPDGQEIEFKKKDGKMTVADPWESGKEVELTPSLIGNLSTMYRDPEKWSDVVRQRQKDDASAAREDKQLTIAADNLKENIRKNGAAELMEGKKYSLDVANSKFDNLLKAATATKYAAEAAEASAATGGMKPDDARQYAESVGKDFEGFLMPVLPADKDDINSKPGVAPPPAGFELFARPDGTGLTGVGKQAKAIAQGIGIFNPLEGPTAASLAGMAITRVLVDDSENAPKVGVYPSRGEISVVIDGRPTTLRVSDTLIRSLEAARKAQDFLKEGKKSRGSWQFDG